MAYQPEDLDKIDAALLSGVKKVTFADGRSTEFHSLDELRRLRADVKAELGASAAQVNPRVRTVVGRIRHR
ncbi:phage head-tail joining protein [Sphingobium chungbukense]|uniref:Uncharacterized protein n=1 Tax=Sphingobium chungbukense TaxID=56193 RepID=A0A0M3AQS9_9SPHN|nr:hypothetical protein [Sphingobium chungbukense]KKW92258.1 hypothetical protein YP76_10005 [Sphingobium chungbukense]